ncbi:GNAT family N-acetyltransferase [Cryptosporangium arvum]|uniref:Putative acyltransferase n=1 Tax=Cryptosporangium arvum DSM 44712 TaxID=927661 RepID=A0A010Z4U4_9ACTN|nr:GNAT family N-acetyltransferase [Cryptosporangium arvum]EXG82368.1 putative acyltransferase [Cryptosporangium arvum DSM 44712]
MRHWGAIAETAEAESLYALASGTSPADRETFGIAATRLGGGVVVSTPEDPTGFWTKVLGLGVTEPVTAGVVDAAVDFLTAHGSTRATFQIAPDRLPDDWDDIAARHGINAGSSWVKLACPMAAFRPGETGLRVRPVTDADADRAAAVIAAGFGMDPTLVAGLYAPAWRSGEFLGFAAWDDDEMVAAAATRLAPPTASMYGAATLPGHRGHGAQSALLAARAAVAETAGCEVLVAETYVPPVEGTNPSLNNMIRAGFEVLYVRVNQVWVNRGR